MIMHKQIDKRRNLSWNLSNPYIDRLWNWTKREHIEIIITDTRQFSRTNISLQSTNWFQSKESANSNIHRRWSIEPCFTHRHQLNLNYLYPPTFPIFFLRGFWWAEKRTGKGLERSREHRERLSHHSTGSSPPLAGKK